MASEHRCNGCRSWYDSRLPDCPDCGHARNAYNPHLRATALDNNLQSQVAMQYAEQQRYTRSLKTEHDMMRRHGIKP